MRRFYREQVGSELVSFEVSYRETDLFVEACRDMRLEVFSLIKSLRDELDEYIERNRDFLTSLKPIKADKKAPAIAQRMMEAARVADVGPMACVAGAFAMYVGRMLLKHCRECVVENGGDVFLKLDREPIIGIYTNNPLFGDKLRIRLTAGNRVYGICSSSARIGPSLSMGRADLAVVVAGDSVLADGLATRVANMIESPDDINGAIEFAKEKGALASLFIKDNRIGLWGALEIV